MLNMSTPLNSSMPIEGTALDQTTSHFKLWTLFYIVLINFLCVLVSAVLWYYLWVKNLGVEIPIEKQVAGLDRRHMFYSTRSPSILLDFFKGMLSKFNRDYWSTQCGHDAYLYLLFQRKMIKLTIVLAVVSLIASMSSNIFIAGSQQEWIEMSTLGNRVLTPITAWIHTSLAIFFTVAAFYIIFEMREEAMALYKDNFKEKCKIKDSEWLKARTLHVRGLLPKDRRGDMRYVSKRILF